MSTESTTSTLIEVASTAEPMPGKKQATVKAADGTTYGVWPDKLGLLRPGRQYAVHFTVREYRGRAYRTITKVDPADGAQTPAETSRATPQSSPNSLDGENAFITQVVAAGVASQQIEATPQAIGRAMRMVQSVYREFQRQSPQRANG